MKNESPIRVRFAPSPTGHLHVGGARTALYNFLFARHTQGHFLIRIEDTDKVRSEERLVQSILESLKWLGLYWDEPPVYQSSRQNRHQEICKSLLASGQAYRCFCPQEALEQKKDRIQQQGIEKQSKCVCTSLSEKEIEKKLKMESFALRFRVPDGVTVFNDLVHGAVTVQNSEIDDFVIQRSDGSPVYQIAVVVDDHDMAITHVIRGDDHLTNTPKQVMLYQAMDWEIPQFGHVPLILGPDQKRLSKRHGATSVEAYRDLGILPETLVNFLALLGWSPGNDLEIMDLVTMIQKFSLERVSVKSAVFDLKKLEWMNSHYLSSLSNATIVEKLLSRLIQTGWISEPVDSEKQNFLSEILSLLKSRMKYLNDFFNQANYFFADPETFEESAVKKHWSEPEIIERLKIMCQDLEKCDSWDELTLETIIRKRAESMGFSASKLIHPVRLAITGSGASPGLFEVMTLLGKNVVLRRLKKVIEILKNE